MASTVSLRFIHSYVPRNAEAKPTVLPLESVSLPRQYEVPDKALVGVAGRTVSPLEAAAHARPRTAAFTIPVLVEVNRAPSERIGWDELTDARSEPYEYLPLARLRNDALEQILTRIVPRGVELEGSLSRLFYRHAVRLKRLVDAVRDISPRTKLMTLDVGEPKERLTLAVLLSARGAEIHQPSGHPFVFTFPTWLPK